MGITLLLSKLHFYLQYLRKLYALSEKKNVKITVKFEYERKITKNVYFLAKDEVPKKLERFTKPLPMKDTNNNKKR